jgi:hypothetical protein
MQTFTPGLWNNPQRVFESRGRIPKPQGMVVQTSDRSLSQPAASAPLPSAPPKASGIPTGIYVGGVVLVLAVIGIFAIK